MIDYIEKLVSDTNIARHFSEKTIDDISQAVSDGYDIDKLSREDWEKSTDESIKLARQVFEQKNYPFVNAANIKYPLLATSSIQFAARAYPNFVKAPDVVKALVIGDDPHGMKADKAERVGQHMSYQCLNEMEEWEEDTDKLLTVLPIVGCCFKKGWFSSVLKRNVSEYRSAKDIVINYKAKSMSTAPRITEVFILYPNEIEERIRSRMFLPNDYGSPTSAKDEEDETILNDPDQPHVFLEQHTWYDLDGDGYKEPYIITFHKDTKQVARITARFDVEGIEREGGRIVKVSPDQYFTKFPFMPSLDGSIYDMGFGQLLTPINKVIDTTINQITDSGTLYNSNAGFLGKGINLGRGRSGGKIEFGLGEWKPVGFVGDDLRKNIFPLPVHEPSMVLFNLLGFMVSAGERLSSVTEILTGDQSNSSERPTTTLARIEQGLKVFSSIHKRLYRSFKQEFKIQYRLNSKFLQPKQYFRILDNQQAIAKSDYDGKSCDVIPVADPNEMTNTQKLIKAQILVGMQGQGYNDGEIRTRFVEAMQFSDAKKLLDAPEPPPDPKVLLEQAKLELDREKFQFEVFLASQEDDERKAKIKKLLAQSLEHIAKAEAAEEGPQLEYYKENLKAITEAFKVKHGNKPGTVGKLEGGSGNKRMVQNASRTTA